MRLQLHEIFHGLLGLHGYTTLAGRQHSSVIERAPEASRKTVTLPVANGKKAAPVCATCG